MTVDGTMYMKVRTAIPSPLPASDQAGFYLKADGIYFVTTGGAETGPLGTGSLPTNDTTSIVRDPGDTTKEMRIDVGNVSTATTRVLTMPDADVTLHKSNLSATAAPTTTDDSGSGYSVGSLWVDTTNDNSYVCVDATTSSAVWNRLNGVYSSLAIIRDEKATTTAGGASSAATYNARDVNTELYDPDAIVTIASNQFTPIAGDYELEAYAPGYKCDRHRLRLYNVTGTASVEEGVGVQADNATQVQNLAHLKCKFTANGTDAYRIDHYTETAQASNGLGRAIGDGSNEVYLVIILRKLT